MSSEENRNAYAFIFDYLASFRITFESDFHVIKILIPAQPVDLTTNTAFDILTLSLLVYSLPPYAGCI